MYQREFDNIVEFSFMDDKPSAKSILLIITIVVVLIVLLLGIPALKKYFKKKERFGYNFS